MEPSNAIDFQLPAIKYRPSPSGMANMDSDRNKPLIFCIAALSFGQLVAGCTVTALAAIHYPNWGVRTTISMLTFALTAAADVLVSFSMCYLLQIRKTPNKISTSMINKIIILTIHNGLFSCSVAILGLITALAAPRSWLSYASCFVLGKAYFNTLLSTLNLRTTLRERLKRHEAMVGIGTETIQRQLDRVDPQEEELHELRWDSTKPSTVS